LVLSRNLPGASYIEVMSEPLNPQPQSGLRPTPFKAVRGGLRRIGDWRQRLGTNGPVSGTSGRRFWMAFGIFAAVGIGVNVLDVITMLHDRPELHPIDPIIWEATSMAALLSLLWIPWLAWRNPIGPFGLFSHAVAAVAFSVGHVTGFILLRAAICGALGRHYHLSVPGDYLYEFPRDLIAYALLMMTFAISGRLNEPRDAPASRSLYDIRDGARLLRVPVDDILAVSSAGNYVEFVLRDGRKPLMRSPLSALEAELAQHGFVRVHRSWLVNAMQMTGLKPEGSGDYTVELGDVTVPLSRRYPEALAKLRAA
jgi:hypothetical protein